MLSAPRNDGRADTFPIQSMREHNRSVTFQLFLDPSAKIGKSSIFARWQSTKQHPWDRKSGIENIKHPVNEKNPIYTANQFQLGRRETKYTHMKKYT